MIYVKQELVILATFMDISIEEDTIHCQVFQGLCDCIHSLRKLMRMKNRRQKDGLLDHFKQPINVDKTVTQLLETLTAFQNRFNSSSAVITGVKMRDFEVHKKEKQLIPTDPNSGQIYEYDFYSADVAGRVFKLHINQLSKDKLTYTDPQH